jgi:amidase
MFSDRVADFSDPHVELLESRGAIVIGKSNMPEFGAGANTYNE